MLYRGMLRCYILGATGGNEKARRLRGIAAQSHGTMLAKKVVISVFRYRVKASNVSRVTESRRGFRFFYLET